MHLKMSSAKWRLFGLGLNELIKEEPEYLFHSAYINAMYDRIILFHHSVFYYPVVNFESLWYRGANWLERSDARFNRPEAWYLHYCASWRHGDADSWRTSPQQNADACANYSFGSDLPSQTVGGLRFGQLFSGEQRHFLWAAQPLCYVWRGWWIWIWWQYLAQCYLLFSVFLCSWMRLPCAASINRKFTNITYPWNLWNVIACIN